MPAHEFMAWAEYHAVEPFGEARADLRMAILASLTANIHAARGKKFKPSDFMPYERQRGKPKSAKEMIAEFDFFFGMHNKHEAEKAKAGT